MNTYHAGDGEHEGGLSDDELKRKLAEIKAADKKRLAGDWAGFIAELNRIEPPREDKPGLGDIVAERETRMHYTMHEVKKRGRKSFQDLGE